MGHADKTVTLKHYTSAILAKLHAAVLLLAPIRRCAKSCAARTRPAQDAAQQTHETPASEAGSAPVAQRIEQRFPKASTAETVVRNGCECADESSVFDAMANGLEPNEARQLYASAQRLHNVVGEGARERSRRAAEVVEGAVAVALDPELGREEKAQALEARLREAGELLAWGGYGT
jgi:hypothetical protein